MFIKKNIVTKHFKNKIELNLLGEFKNDSNYSSFSQIFQFINTDNIDENKRINFGVFILIFINEKNYCADRIRSFFTDLFKFTPPDVEIFILCDIGKRKELGDILKKIPDYFAFLKLKIITVSNNNFTREINFVLKKRRGLKCVFLQINICLIKNWLSKIICSLNKKNVGIVSPLDNNDFINNILKNKFFTDYTNYNNLFNGKTNDKISNLADFVCFSCFAFANMRNDKFYEIEYKNLNLSIVEFYLRKMSLGYLNIFVQDLYLVNLDKEQKSIDYFSSNAILIKKYQLCVNAIMKYKKQIRKNINLFYTIFFINYMKKLNPKKIVIDLFAHNNGANEFSKHNLQGTKENNIFIKYELFSDKLMLNLYNGIQQSKMNFLLVEMNCFQDFDSLLKFYNSCELIINNLAFFKKIEELASTLTILQKKYDLLITYYFHDYVSVCPSISMLTKKYLPCVYKNEKECERCLIDNNNVIIKTDDIRVYRKLMCRFLHSCNNLIFFSNYTLNRVKCIYNDLPVEKCKIIGHKPLINNIKGINISKKRINIGFFGFFTKAKGANYFINLKRKFEKEHINARFFIIGQPCEQYSTIQDISYTGIYDRNNLVKHISDYSIDIAIFPSISNETFSYTVQELMLLKMPIVVFPSGAHADRLKEEKYPYFTIAKGINDDSLYKATIDLINKLGIKIDYE